jgi:ketosteroid isomerase-like protein
MARHLKEGVQMAHIWTFRDGKIIAFQQHVDTFKVQELSA